MNPEVFKLFCSGMSQRRMAKHLNVHGTTISRKLKFLAIQSRARNAEFLRKVSSPFTRIQVDEMETFEHSKCKPLSIALMVSDDPKRERVILGFEVSQMPAKGPLAEISREKYGFRRDFRSEGLKTLFEKTSAWIQKTPHITTDQNPRYPGLIHQNWKKTTHVAVKGRRGCIVGQGELKKIGFDPLFSLNHTCAMFRANVNRLFRKTWCTTKKIEGLVDHLSLYMDYHNHRLLQLDV